MIAPIRKSVAPRSTPPTKTGLRRARRWIVKTLINDGLTSPTVAPSKLRVAAAAAWIVIVAAVYFGQLAVDVWTRR